MGEVFIADRLENGAGYATWLSQNIEGCWSPPTEDGQRRSWQHAVDGCDGSCYDCLRDYSNAPYHPLLDWFLAKEALSLLSGEALDLTGDPWDPAVAGFATAFGWEVVRDVPGARVLTSVRGEKHLVVAHPLLRTDGEAAGPLGGAVEGLAHLDLMVTSGYELARRPGLVESAARAGRLPRLGKKA